MEQQFIIIILQGLLWAKEFRHCAFSYEVGSSHLASQSVTVMNTTKTVTDGGGIQVAFRSQPLISGTLSFVLLLFRLQRLWRMNVHLLF